MAKADKTLPAVQTPPTGDPLNLNGRLYSQVGQLLTQLETGEHITLKERVAALIAVGRLQTIFMGLRKERTNDPAGGEAVRKYADAFKTDDGRGGKKGARRGTPADDPGVELDDNWFEDAERGGEDLLS
jgi:hypothetical protein